MVFLNQILHAQVIRPFIGPSVGFSARVVWSKGWGSFGRKWGLFWTKNKGILGKYQDTFGGCLQWEKFGSRLGMHLGS